MRASQRISIPYGSIKRSPALSFAALLATFQFLMVRLKDHRARHNIHTSQISIPYGSIKRMAQMEKGNFRSRFQFLMVRLKEFSLLSSSCINSISIPYGSIKSRETTPHLLSIDVISIPYGSIKSRSDHAPAQPVPLFQFLMVRLKVRAVSLPHLHYLFQFLMVRLKETMHRRDQETEAEFQFLMVRLKGLRGKRPLWRVSSISIPYGSIKSFELLDLCVEFLHFNSLWFD